MPELFNDQRVLVPPAGWSAVRENAEYGDRFWRLSLDYNGMETETDEFGIIRISEFLTRYDSLIQWARDAGVSLMRPGYHDQDVHDAGWDVSRILLSSVRVDTHRGWDYTQYNLTRLDDGGWVGSDCESCSDPAHPGEEYCQSCMDQRQDCEGCGEGFWQDDIYYNDNQGAYYCESCDPGDGYDDEPCYDEVEEQDNVADMPVLSAEGLGFEARYFNPERGTQLTSVELEFGHDPSGVADLLYNRGLSTTSTVGGYHGQARSNRGSSYVEHDASVSNGGEMVISMVNLPDEQETLRLWHTVKVLRDRVHAGDNRLDMRCGCHIHVNALGRDLNSIISTVVAYNHIEDILYRLSAANYKHHRMDNGNGYCNKTEKSITDKDRFRASFGSQRYYGLNVGNYLQYRYNCNCGAGFDHADRCQCDTGQFYKPTLEFRLFNTTANGAKLHAFIAICQALTHYGMNRTLLSADLEPMEYAGNGYSLRYTPNDYAERLTWMLSELPFSASERNSIRYCIRNSDIKGILEGGVRDGTVLAEVVQGILHEDEMLAIDAYEVPERVEEATNTRAQWRDTHERDRYGNRLVIDLEGRFRDPVSGRYASVAMSQVHDEIVIESAPPLEAANWLLQADATFNGFATRVNEAFDLVDEVIEF